MQPTNQPTNKGPQAEVWGSGTSGEEESTRGKGDWPGHPKATEGGQTKVEAGTLRIPRDLTDTPSLKCGQESEDKPVARTGGLGSHYQLTR